MHLHLFEVSINIPRRNIKCHTLSLASTDVDAIKATKARLEDCLDNFIGHHRRQKDIPFKLPEDLYADAEIKCSLVTQPKLIGFEYDRIRNTEPFHV
jgi:hypothetical protein